MRPDWLDRACETCGAASGLACRDEDGYLGNPHDTRLHPTETRNP